MGSGKIVNNIMAIHISKLAMLCTEEQEELIKILGSRVLYTRVNSGFTNDVYICRKATEKNVLKIFKDPSNVSNPTFAL